MGALPYGPLLLSPFIVSTCPVCRIMLMIMGSFGSCGGLVPELPVGSLTIPKSAIAVNRNYDFDFSNADENFDGYLDAYKVSKPVSSVGSLVFLLIDQLLFGPQTNADPVLHQLVNHWSSYIPSYILSSFYRFYLQID